MTTTTADQMREYALANLQAAKPAETCNYPDCNCPFDAPADPNWCARGLPKSLEKIAERHLRQDLYLFGLEGLLSDPAILNHIPAVKALRENLMAKWEAAEQRSDEQTRQRMEADAQLAELRQGGEAVGWQAQHRNGGKWSNMGIIQPTEDAALAALRESKAMEKRAIQLYTRPQPAIPPGYAVVPDWHGYALLGTGRYILNASPPPMDPDLGAEFCITLATDEDRSDNRQIGEIRDNTRTTPYQPEEIAIRIRFLTPQALDAMEAQLTILRKDHWPETISPSVPVAEKAEKPHVCRVVLSAAMLREALEYANPDGPEDADQVETEMVIEWMRWMPARTSIDGEPMPAGYYAYYVDYPEEGVLGPLGEPILAAPADSQEG